MISVVLLLTEQTSHDSDVFIKNFSNLKNFLNTNNLMDHFVTERIISIEDKEKSNVDSLLHSIGLNLKSGINRAFRTMLDIIERYGSLAGEELAKRIKKELQVGRVSKVEAITVDFTTYDEVTNMFTALHSALRKMLSEDELPHARRACRTNKKTLKLSDEFIDEINATTTLDDLFDVVIDSPHCDWMNIRLLEQIAAASLQNNTRQLIQQYKEAIFLKKLKDVFQQFSEIQVKKDYFAKVKKRWKKKFDDVTIKDVFGQWWKLEKLFDIKPSLWLEHVIEGSVEFHWLIPSELVHHARYSAFKNWCQLDDILYLDIGGHVIKDSQHDFSITNSNTGKQGLPQREQSRVVKLPILHQHQSKF